MGQAKWRQEDYDDRGFDSLGTKFICAEHFEDVALREKIEELATECQCSYCDRKSSAPISVIADVVVELVVDAINYNYDQAVESLPFDSREGGYQFSDVWDTYDLLVEQLELGIDSTELLTDLYNVILGGPWCPKDPFAITEESRLSISWDEFRKVTMHGRRYFFASFQPPAYSPYEIERPSAPRQLLDEIAKAIDRLDLFLDIDSSTDLFRARLSANKLRLATEIGSPPAINAMSSNRMSPAGIPMFYGAFEEGVALEEVLQNTEPAGFASIGRFGPAHPMTLVDLTKLPLVPSLFDTEGRNERSVVSFLHEFAKEVSKPLSTGVTPHVEYVPTQVLTEFLRYEFTPQRRIRVDGLVYWSAVCSESKCVVLFVENTECADPEELSEITKVVLKDVRYETFEVAKRTPLVWRMLQFVQALFTR